MKVTHYLEAVSAAIEAHNMHVDAAYEEFRNVLGALDPANTDARMVAEYEFKVEQARALATMENTMANLRKWPLT